MAYVPSGPRNRPSLDPTLALLVADDPRGQARKLLDHVATRCRARGAAVVTVVADDLSTFAGEVPLSRLGVLQRRWKVDHKTVHQKLAQITPHVPDGRGIRRAEVDE